MIKRHILKRNHAYRIYSSPALSPHLTPTASLPKIEGAILCPFRLRKLHFLLLRFRYSLFLLNSRLLSIRFLIRSGSSRLKTHNIASLDATVTPVYLLPGSIPNTTGCLSLPEGSSTNCTTNITNFVLIGFAFPSFIHLLALDAFVGISGSLSGTNTGTLFEIILLSEPRLHEASTPL